MTATRQSSRSASNSRIDRSPACWSDCSTIRSSSSSVSSGTSVNFVHGHFSAGPNCSMKWRMPASPPAMRYTRNVPIALHRRPAPNRIASSICSTVATPSFTSHSASRHNASSSRSATNPSISLSSSSGRIPTDRYTSAARAVAAGDVDSPPQISTSGRRYTGLNGWPTTSRSGWSIPSCSIVGQQARRRGGEHDRGVARRARPAEDGLLQVDPLRRALLHEVGAGDRLLWRCGEVQLALARRWRHRQPARTRAERCRAPRRPCAGPPDPGRTSPHRPR